MNRTDFSSRVTGCQDRLYRVALTILGRSTDAEDAVQTALLSAWRAIGSLKYEQYFETWLIRILINTCRTEMRARLSRPCTLGDDNRIEVPNPPPPDVGLFAALAALDEKYRIPLMLHCAEGYDVREIADMLKLPVGAVKWRIHQGRTKLGKIMEKEAAEI